MSREPLLALPDPEAFAANQAFLRRLALSLAGDGASADDLVQETWTSWAAARPAGLRSLRSWLAHVMRNRATSFGRGAERRARRELAVARSEVVEPEPLAAETIEMQARVVESLRSLEEPFRSTLLLRYYHDLSPSAIAARTAAPLNTVKTRLARGLERMRAELDRRAGGRDAWAFALLGSEAGSAAGAAESTAARSDAAGWGVSDAARGGGGSGGGSWLLRSGLAAGLPALAGAVVLLVWWNGQEESSRAGAAPRPNEDAVARLAIPEELSDAPSREAIVAPSESVKPPSPPESPWAEDFDWPQLAGSSDHDNLRPRTDHIRAPRVLWRVEGCYGQPTIHDGDLYSGGAGLFRIDPRDGRVLAHVLAEPPPKTEEEFHELMREQEQRGSRGTGFVGMPITVAEAPVLTHSLVLASRGEDGGITAFDRTLTSVAWQWSDEFPTRMNLAGCLAGELLVIARGSRVIALRTASGEPAWRFECVDEGTIQMIPAAANGRVFFGTESGVFYALDLATGARLWRVETGGWLAAGNPVVSGERLLFADRGNARFRPNERVELDRELQRDLQALGYSPSVERRGELVALSVADGSRLWRTDFGATGFSTPGIGRGFALGGFGTSLALFDLATGTIDEARRIHTGRNAFGSPTLVGESIVFGNLDGHLYVHDLSSGRLRWAVRVPEAQVGDFVHSGERIYVSTTRGLFCLADDPAAPPASEGFVLTADVDALRSEDAPLERGR